MNWNLFLIFPSFHEYIILKFNSSPLKSYLSKRRGFSGENSLLNLPPTALVVLFCGMTIFTSSKFFHCQTMPPHKKIDKRNNNCECLASKTHNSILGPGMFWVCFGIFCYVLVCFTSSKIKAFQMRDVSLCHGEAMIIGAEALEVPGVFTTEGLKIPVERQQDMTSLKLT